MSRHLVTFTGDAAHPGTDPNTITVFGLTFPFGEAVPINVTSPDGERIIGKLRGNRHFSVEDVADEETPAPKRRGRPPKSEVTETEEESHGDENDE